MRILKAEEEFNSRSDRFFELIPVGDVHAGHINCHKDMFINTIEYIKNKPNARWIGMGDYADAISTSDKRFDFSAVDPALPTPDKQYRWIKEQFEPIADKCLGLLDGNHDRKHWTSHNHNYVDSLCYDLGVEYLTMDAYLRWVFIRNKARTAINIYAHHGWAASRSTGGKVNTIHSLSEAWPMLDLYLMGHTHDRGVAPPKVQMEINQNMEHVHHEMNFVHTGAYLRGYVDGTFSYVEEKGYRPAGLGSPIISIEIDPGSKGKYAPPRYTFGTVPYEEATI